MYMKNLYPFKSAYMHLALRRVFYTSIGMHFQIKVSVSILTICLLEATSVICC